MGGSTTKYARTCIENVTYAIFKYIGEFFYKIFKSYVMCILYYYWVFLSLIAGRRSILKLYWTLFLKFEPHVTDVIGSGMRTQRNNMRYYGTKTLFTIISRQLKFLHSSTENRSLIIIQYHLRLSFLVGNR